MKESDSSLLQRFPIEVTPRSAEIIERGYLQRGIGIEQGVDQCATDKAAATGNDDLHIFRSLTWRSAAIHYMR
jgi:hypothetical protein